MIRALAALACFQLCACTSSEVPITSADPTETDTRLVGTWRVVSLDDAIEDEDRISVRQLPNGALLVQEIPKKGSDPAHDMEAVTARFGEELYASLREKDARPESAEFLLLRYQHDSPDRVRVFLAPMEQLERAVERQWIRGRKRSGRHFDTFRIEASEQELRRFILAHGRSVFTKQGPVLVRVREE